MSGIELAMTRRGATLVPASPAFLEDLEKIQEGKEVLVTVRMARNPRHDRWFHATIAEVIRAGAWNGDAESFRRYLKIALGYAEEIVGADGKVFYVLQSLSPASMDKIRFTDFVRRVEQHVAERWGIDIGELRKTVRGSAGADAEPDWNAGEKVLSAPAGEGEVPGPASSPVAELDKTLLWEFSATIGTAMTRPAIIQIAETFKANHAELAEPRYAAVCRSICKIHITHVLEPQWLPYEKFEAAMLALIENGEVPTW